MHEALEKNFDWVVSQNTFDERSQPKGSERETLSHEIGRAHV